MSMNTILLLDFDPNSVEEIRQPLEEAGFHVSVARDGEEGVLTFRHLAPDLVIIEPMLPGKNGFEVCRTIKDAPGGADTPVVALTGYYSAAEYEARAIEEYGFDQFIEKPLPGARLVATCCKLLSAARVAKAPDSSASPAAPVVVAANPSLPGPIEAFAQPGEPSPASPAPVGEKLRRVDVSVLAPPPGKRRRTLGAVLLKPRKVWGVIALLIVAGFLAGLGLAQEAVGGEGGFALPNIHWIGDFAGPPPGADLFGPHGTEAPRSIRDELIARADGSTLFITDEVGSLTEAGEIDDLAEALDPMLEDDPAPEELSAEFNSVDENGLVPSEAGGVDSAEPLEPVKPDSEAAWLAFGADSETFGVSEIVEESLLEFRGTSTVKSGTLILLVDGTEVHSVELSSGARGAKRFFKKIAGNAGETLEFSISVTAGEHEIVARLLESDQSYVYESRLVVAADPDAEIPLKIVASRSGKRKITLELDESTPEIAQLDF